LSTEIYVIIVDMEKKICPRCKKKKQTTEFTKSKSRKDGLSVYCKECQRRYVRSHYQKNTEYYKNKAEKRRKAQRKKLQQLAQKAKDVPCVDCGKRYPYYVMDFDHVRGEKILEVAKLVARTVSVKRLLDEIAKCDAVCSNCHRERSYGPKS